MAATLRIWASEDGESHLEDVDLPFEESDYLPPAAPMHLTPPSPATGYFVARVPPGWKADWHPTPGRQLVVYLSGEGEIEASDGTVRRLHPGTILLVDDTTGKGHLSRVTSTEEALVVVVTLPDETGGA